MKDSDLISRSDVKALVLKYADNEDVETGWNGAIDAVFSIPAVDAVEVVRCEDCKYRKVNEHFGEKGYMKLKAICTLDTGDPFELGRNAEDDDWFCKDGQRREDGDGDG